jgi:glycosyltransferase involved in cell wall biosynthesis
VGETAIESRHGRSLTLLCAKFRPERYGGVEERLWRITNEMARRGWRVNVLTENRLNAPAKEEIVPGITVHRFPAFAPGGIGWRWWYFSYVIWWYRVLRAHRPIGVVWATDPVMTTAAILAGHRRRLVSNPASCAAAVAHIGRVHAAATSLQVPRVLERIDRFAYRLPRVVVVSSASVRDQLARFYGARADVHVCPYAANHTAVTTTRGAARASLGLREHGFVVGFTGRLDPCKGVEFLFAAVRQAGLGPDDRLLMIGDGPDRPRLEALAREEGIADSVLWTGHVKEPAGLYPALDVLVLPSVYEAFGLVLVEAMTAGVPVMGRAQSETVFTATAEIVVDGVTGWAIRSDDPQELAGRLSWLRTHPDERARMGAAGQAHAGRRTWVDLVDEYDRILSRFD